MKIGSVPEDEWLCRKRSSVCLLVPTCVPTWLFRNNMDFFICRLASDRNYTTVLRERDIASINLDKIVRCAIYPTLCIVLLYSICDWTWSLSSCLRLVTCTIRLVGEDIFQISQYNSINKCSHSVSCSEALGVGADRQNELAGCALPPGSVGLARCHPLRLPLENGCFSAATVILAACS